MLRGVGGTTLAPVCSCGQRRCRKTQYQYLFQKKKYPRWRRCGGRRHRSSSCLEQQFGLRMIKWEVKGSRHTHKPGPAETGDGGLSEAAAEAVQKVRWTVPTPTNVCDNV